MVRNRAKSKSSQNRTQRSARTAPLRRCSRLGKLPECGLRSDLMRRTGPTSEFVYPVGDALGGIAQLFHGPVGGVALGDVRGRGMVDQPLGQAGRKHELAVSDGDEAVAKRMEPEPGPARFPSARVEVRDGFEVAGGAGLVAAGRGMARCASLLLDR